MPKKFLSGICRFLADVRQTGRSAIFLKNIVMEWSEQ